MGYFSNDKKMYVPLTIDNVQTVRSNYFFSNTKVLIAVGLIFPLIIYEIGLIKFGAGIRGVIISALIYIILYTIAIRKWVFEEKLLKKMLKELDENKRSGIDHFWDIDKIGGGEDDDGTIYYSLGDVASGTARGLLVTMDRGSIIGVPEGHFRDFRNTKEEFLRKIYRSRMNVGIYDIQKEPEMQKSIINDSNLLSIIKNEGLQKLLQLQIGINAVYSMGNQQRYVDYYLVIMENYSKDFRKMVESMVDETFGQNGYFINPHICTKREVEDFFENYLKIGTLDSDSIRKSVNVKPFENFAKVIRLMGKDGSEVPIEFLGEDDVFGNKKGESLEELIEKDEKESETIKRRNKELYDKEIGKLNRIRNRDRITNNDYLNRKEELDKLYEENDDFYKALKEFNQKKEKGNEKVDKELKREDDKKGPEIHEFKERTHVDNGDEVLLEDLLRNEGFNEENDEHDEHDNKDDEEIGG